MDEEREYVESLVIPAELKAKIYSENAIALLGDK
jgi:hypothetical protein